jgi:hypothetical protein
MSGSRIFRGQPKLYEKCLFVPSALRGYKPEQYSLSGDIHKVENFLLDIKKDINQYKGECETISKKGPFQNCANEIPYIFWISIVFCEYKFSHVGKPTSFMGGGPIPYPIDMGFDITDSGDEFKFNILCAQNIEEYAVKMGQCYFGHTPPAKTDNFIRKYMDHQHYDKGIDNGDPCLKGSFDYETWPKYYKNENNIIDGNNLPDHFTFLLDWTESRTVAEKFAGSGGTIVSMDSEKYDKIVGENYKMSYKDEIIQYFLIDTADRQKSVVTFWPWAFTINDLLSNELGRLLDFKLEQ